MMDGLPEATAPVPDARKSGGMKVEPTHRHRFTKGAHPIRSETRGRLQVPIYHYVCECGETKEE